MREFLHVDDLAQAVVFSLENSLQDHLYNVGTGIDITIKDLAYLVQDVTKHEGLVRWDNTKPDGTPRKLLDIGRLKDCGWYPKITLKSGLNETYEWFKANYDNLL